MPVYNSNEKIFESLILLKKIFFDCKTKTKTRKTQS